MRLGLVAVGRLRRGPEQELAERYRARIDALGRGLGVATLDIAEIPEGRARSTDERQAEEGAAILARAGSARLLVFDERGVALSSESFAERVGAWRDGGAALLACIGGPDGLHADVRARADLCLAFGRLTLPHQIVRVLVLEQLYRALTILAGHPYHRGEP